MTGSRRRLLLLASVAFLAFAACGGDEGAKTTSPTSTTVVRERPFDLPATTTAHATERVTFRGTLSLDGAPVDAEYVGAVVRDRGLVTPCQVSLPPVTGGRYEITVYGAAESSGCGKQGAEVALWVFADGKTLYTDGFAPWPGSGNIAAFDGRVTASAPSGAVPATAQFNGDAFSKAGARMPAGTRVEAYVGTTRCGVASTRRTADYSGFVLAVVGPDAIPGCRRGAPLTFRVDGRPAHGAAVNAPRTHGKTMNLQVR